MDRISKLPVGVIESILCLLPIQEAARTSILSKEWRYHWIKIPKLEFIEDQFQEWTRGPKPSAIELRLNKPSKRKDMAKSVWTHKKTLHRLLSSCPLLKRLALGHGMTILYDVEGSTIVDLFGCVPVIEYLYVVVFGLEDFLPKRLPKKLPTSLVHLKYLCVTVDTLCFTNIYGLPFLALLFRSSPNLETVKLVMWGEEPYVDEDDLGSFTLDDYSDITLEHLKEFEILDFTDSENELDFVRLILAKSPVLKKMTVTPHYFFDKDEESVSEVSEILFCSPCASPVVEIIVGRYKSDYWCPW
ncbi:putative FBD domain, leucine-rich repeat domain superfamily, F-box-like domain superfamily [Helianthus annuus]|nr:putative FBD domain, leucine-rich repeat domain superfamily, F-box-like domain superfamily [Helianthus annuus]